MRKNIAKKLFCTVLAGAMILGEAGTAFAATESADDYKHETEIAVEAEDYESETPAEVTEEALADEVTEATTEEVTENTANEGAEAVAEETTETTDEAAAVVNDVEDAYIYEENEANEAASAISVDTAAELAVDYEIKIDDFVVDNYGDSYTGINAYGSAASYKMYINNVLFNEGTGSEWGGSFSFYESYNMIYGASYTFKLDACDETGAVKATKTVTKKLSFPGFSKTGGYSNVYGTTYYDKQGHTTGYQKPYVYVSQPIAEGSGYASITYEVYRAEGKASNTYTKIATVTASYSVSYSDYTVVPGKKYFYKFCPVSGTDAYVKTPVKGSMSSPIAVNVAAPTTEVFLNYTSEGVGVSMGDYSFSSAFEIYRSTNAKKGFKKIATTSDTYYLDKSAKEGSTYYYKVKPIYYDIASKKTYKGKYSETKGVKLILGYINANIEQTAATKATLTWDKVPGANSYEVWMKSNDYAGDAYKKVATTNGLKYIAKGLSKTGSYSFVIKACKKSGSTVKYYESSTSYIQMGFHDIYNSYIAKKTSKLSKDGKTLTITSTIKWEKIYGANGYIVEAYDNAQQKYVTIKKITKYTTTSYKFANPITASGAKYSWVRVIPYKGKLQGYGNSCYDISYFPSVAGVKVKKKNSTSVSVSWKKMAGAEGYNIYKTTPTGNRVLVGTTAATSFVDSYVTPGVNYTYTVKAYNSKFNIYSGDETLNTYKHVLSVPGISSVKNSAKKTATITWKKTPYATKYLVYRSTSKNGTYKKVAAVASSKTSYKDKKVSKGKTYYYKVVVQAVNDAGLTVTSKASKAKSVKIVK